MATTAIAFPKKVAEERSTEVYLPPGASKLTQADIDVLIETQAPKYGLDPALVERISACEDAGNPYSIGMKAYVGEDYGPLQVNSYFHSSEMKAEGLDITNPVDSLTFGLEMMQKEGTQPWLASARCWRDGDESAAY